MIVDVVNIIGEQNDSLLLLYCKVANQCHNSKDGRTVEQLQFGSLGPTLLPDKTSEVFTRLIQNKWRIISIE